ncbi:MAG: YcaO-like family protein [Proteobacteria bacterium]|nr:YcaO-like family protein [Pseudomonadota bacterium]
MHNRLAALQQSFPIGAAWQTPEVLVEAQTIDGRQLHLVGMCSQGDEGDALTSSAAAWDTVPFERCYFELLERSAALAAARGARGDALVRLDHHGRPVGFHDRRQAFPEVPGVAWRHSLSNGVAAHPEPDSACERAHLEAVERDRVLRSWFGVAPPPRPTDPPAGLAPLDPAFDVRAVTFHDPQDPEPEIEVAGVFLIPREPEAPLCCGFGAGNDAEAARARAEAECLQRLGFLRGEPLPVAAPPPSATPDFHLDHHLFPGHHRTVVDWLRGVEPEATARVGSARRTGERSFLDLSPPHLEGRVAVVRAVAPGRLSLGFGPGHPNVAGLSPDRRVHPIA